MSLKNEWPISLAMTARYHHDRDKVWRLPYSLEEAQKSVSGGMDEVFSNSCVLGCPE